LTQAFTDGMHAAGMPTTGKHFPGHGAVAADSHVAVPVDHRPFDEIWQHDLLPYRDLIEGGHLDAIMTAHIVYDAIDLNPPCFSPFWLQQILRQRLEFDGVIISDDLTMVGAATVGSYARRAELALQAGCDMLLICNKRAAVLEVLEHLTQSAYDIDPIASQRIKKLYGRCNIDNPDLSAHADWHAVQALELVGSVSD
jgi:beta-N-acetylhexosaminidase